MAAPTASDPRKAKLQGRAQKSSTDAVVAILSDLFGSSLSARIAGVNNPEIINDWAKGRSEPAASIADRLRMTLSIADLLLEHETPAIVRSWFGGQNRMLGDVSPASVMGSDPDAIWRAARAFRAYG